MADIPSVKLSAQELDNCQKIMRKGAASLKQLAEMTGMEQRALRARLFKKDFNPADWPELSTEQVAVFVQAIPTIQAVRNIEWRLVCAFSRLAKKHANTWAKKVNGSLEYEDFEQEALLALLDAIYTYNQEEVHFMTYAWRVIRNRLATIANKANYFGPLTNEAMRLLKKFDEVRTSFNYTPTDQEVFEAMGLTDDQIAVVNEARVKCVPSHQSHQVGNTQFMAEHEGEGSLNDYTAARRGIDNEKDTVPCNYEIREAMENANLTPLERRIVETSLFPHYGWQTEIAQETINPATGEPYTNARISQMLQIALKKIKAAYLKRNVA
jgi:RNA polymerase sigma factor (sigma-70 family)